MKLETSYLSDFVDEETEEVVPTEGVREILDEFQGLIKHNGWKRLVKTMDNMERAILDQLQVPSTDISRILVTEGLKGQIRTINELRNIPKDVIAECLQALEDAAVNKEAAAEQEEKDTYAP